MVRSNIILVKLTPAWIVWSYDFQPSAYFCWIHQNLRVYRQFDPVQILEERISTIECSPSIIHWRLNLLSECSGIMRRAPNFINPLEVLFTVLGRFDGIYPSRTRVNETRVVDTMYFHRLKHYIRLSSSLQIDLIIFSVTEPMMSGHYEVLRPITYCLSIIWPLQWPFSSPRVSSIFYQPRSSQRHTRNQLQVFLVVQCDRIELQSSWEDMEFHIETCPFSSYALLRRSEWWWDLDQVSSEDQKRDRWALQFLSYPNFKVVSFTCTRRKKWNWDGDEPQIGSIRHENLKMDRLKNCIRIFLDDVSEPKIFFFVLRRSPLIVSTYLYTIRKCFFSIERFSRLRVSEEISVGFLFCSLSRIVSSLKAMTSSRVTHSLIVRTRSVPGPRIRFRSLNLWGAGCWSLSSKLWVIVKSLRTFRWFAQGWARMEGLIWNQ